MALNVRHPGLILSRPGPWTFSILFFFESVARATLVTVLPLTAYGLLGGKEAVSLAYTAVSLLALGFTFMIPMLVRRLSRRWAYTLGASLLGLYALLLALDAPLPLVLAMFCRTAGAALLNVTLSLYIMDAIGKRDLTRSEPLRLATATLAGQDGLVICTAYSPDGKTLAVGSMDNTVRLWDPDARKVRATLSGHRDWVFSVAFSPDGKTLASAGREGSVFLWDAATGKKLAAFTPHPSECVCVAFAPDGKTLASGGVDGVVNLWDVSKLGKQ